MFSPGLEQFINSHHGTLELLTNTLFEAFSNKTVVLYYFYTEDKSRPQAGHYYPNDATVEIMLEENEAPVDQFIGFIFEAVNSEGEKNFKHICLQAEAGEISKEQ